MSGYYHQQQHQHQHQHDQQEAHYFQNNQHDMALVDDQILDPMFQPGFSQPGQGAMYTPAPMSSYPPISSPSASSSSAYYTPSMSTSPNLAATSYEHSPYWTSPQPAQLPSFNFPQYSAPPGTLAPSQTLYQPTSFLPDPLISDRISRSPSASSNSTYPSQIAEETPFPSYHMSRGASPGSPDLRAYGYQNKNGTWSCAYEGCTSRAVFTRGCDLRKHYKRHTKSFFCRHEGCPQATGGGFSSKKDLARHEAKHNPGVLCEWDGCSRIFSRVDNMRDHVKRIHLKGSRASQ